jgi:hypothetical protein
VKLRILLLIVVGAAGIGASYALAASGNHGGKHDSTVTTGTTTGTTGTTTNPSCQWAFVSGTTSSPQTFTVTVADAGKHSSFAPGQVVTVTVGGTGQTVRLNAVGCANGSAFAAKGAELHVSRPMTTMTTTTGSTSTQTTTTKRGDENGNGGGWHHHGHH